MKFLNFSLFFLILVFLNCTNINKINILTDDSNILEIVDEFNVNNKNKAFIDYISPKNLADKNQDNLFKYAIDNKLYNYDIILGSINSQTVIDSNRFCNLKNYVNFTKKKNNDVFNYIYDYLDKNDYLILPYRINFPVILAEKNVLKNKDINYVSVNDFMNITDENKYYINNLYFFNFLPEMTGLKEIDYYFLFNSEIIYSNNKYNFISSQSMKAFEFYNKFYELNKFDKKEAAEYVLRNIKISRDFYLKQKIIRLDITMLSNALAHNNEHNVIFFNDLNNCGLNNYTLAMQKSSLNKRNSSVFIDYLMDHNVQKFLYDLSINNQITVTKFIPVYKKIINSDDFNIKNFNFDEYIDRLKSVNFFNNKLKKKFFNNYNSAKEKLNSGIINDSKFIEYFSEQLNK